MTEPSGKPAKVISVGMATVKIGPIGSALYAEEFLLAGNALPEQSQAKGNTRFSPVPYYLYCRALELSLKAFLLTKDFTIAELASKKYGHDLETLWKAAESEGLPDVLGKCDPALAGDLKDANAYYKGKAFEYFDFRKWAHGYIGLPPLNRFRSETQQVTSKVKAYCLSVC
jgi:hypothetical protein